MSSKFRVAGVCLLGVVMAAAFAPASLAKDRGGGGGGRANQGQSGHSEAPAQGSGAIQSQPGNVEVQPSTGPKDTGNRERVKSGVREDRHPITGQQAIQGQEWMKSGVHEEHHPEMGDRGWTWNGRRDRDMDNLWRVYPWYSWYGFRQPGYYYSGYVYSNDDSELDPYAEEYPPAAVDMHAQALAAFRHGDYDNAAKLAGHIVVDDPRNADGHILLMLATFAKRDYRTAAMEAHAVAATGRIPDWPALAGIYRDVQPYTEQLRALEAFVRNNPSAAEGRFLLGFQYLMEGHRDAAVPEFSRAVAIVPRDHLAAHLLTQAGGKAQAPTPPPSPIR
jgi:hypothetical protein